MGTVADCTCDFFWFFFVVIKIRVGLQSVTYVQISVAEKSRKCFIYAINLSTHVEKSNVEMVALEEFYPFV